MLLGPLIGENRFFLKIINICSWAAFKKFEITNLFYGFIGPNWMKMKKWTQFVSLSISNEDLKTFPTYILCVLMSMLELVMSWCNQPKNKILKMVDIQDGLPIAILAKRLASNHNKYVDALGSDDDQNELYWSYCSSWNPSIVVFSSYVCT